MKSYEYNVWPSVKLRTEVPPEYETIRASSCATLPGATQASIVYSPVLLMRSLSFLLAVVEPCALPPRMLMPQPPTHDTSPEIVRLSAGSTPLVSYATLPLPVLNSQSPIVFAV